MSKVLITGASGFVGSHIVESLLDKGYETYAGVRKTSSLKYLTDPRIKFFALDFENEKALKQDLSRENFDYIILNAGITKAKDEATYFKVNSAYTRKFCKIIIEESLIPRKLIYISSIAAYGPADFQPDGLVSNDSTPHPVTRYGRSKLQAEQFLSSFIQIPKLIFRPTVVYGPRDYDMLEMYKTIKKGFEIYIGGVDPDLSIIYVEDLANLITTSLKSETVNKSYFVSDGNLYKGSLLNSTIAQQLNKKTIRISLPVGILKGLARISEAGSKITGKFPILNIDKLNELIPKSWNCDGHSVQKDFNFAPQFDLEKGMKKTIDWCKSQSLL